MRKTFEYQSPEPSKFLSRLIEYSREEGYFTLMLSNDETSKVISKEFDWMCGFGCRSKLQTDVNVFTLLNHFQQRNHDWLLGYLSYDTKNEVEKLGSNNSDNLGFPESFFFVPEILLISKQGVIQCHSHNENIDAILQRIESQEIAEEKLQAVEFNKRIKKEEYLEAVVELQRHIQRGDIYEVNFCQEFFAENTKIDPTTCFRSMKDHFSAPFSCFLKFEDRYILSFSPERFLKKSGDKLVSQPIKGTTKRGLSPEEDQQLIKELANNKKEQSENVMIVDLVRNDLSKHAEKGSVSVDELFGIYSFPTVHQMISTISSTPNKDVCSTELIKDCFPMGSMTGAPKVEAMKLIEKYESTKRGVFSGTMGYIAPNGDFDLNVVIRTLVYNESNRYISLITGGAITIQSDPEKEYEESLLKAQAFFDLLGEPTYTNV